jgi:hypothetical protein
LSALSPEYLMQVLHWLQTQRSTSLNRSMTNCSVMHLDSAPPPISLRRASYWPTSHRYLPTMLRRQALQIAPAGLAQPEQAAPSTNRRTLPIGSSLSNSRNNLKIKIQDHRAAISRAKDKTDHAARAHHDKSLAGNPAWEEGKYRMRAAESRQIFNSNPVARESFRRQSGLLKPSRLASLAV